MLPSDQVTVTVAGSAGATPDSVTTSAGCTNPTTVGAGSLTVTVQVAAPRLPSAPTKPETANVPAWAYDAGSTASHATASSVTSPFDQVTSTVSGSRGAVPASVEESAGAMPDTVAGWTVTLTATVSPQPSTVPSTSKEPPSRAV